MTKLCYDSQTDELFCFFLIEHVNTPQGDNNQQKSSKENQKTTNKVSLLLSSKFEKLKQKTYHSFFQATKTEKSSSNQPSAQLPLTTRKTSGSGLKTANLKQSRPTNESSSTSSSSHHHHRRQPQHSTEMNGTTTANASSGGGGTATATTTSVPPNSSSSGGGGGSARYSSSGRSHPTTGGRIQDCDMVSVMCDMVSV
ncbi:hypothetical protein CAEBREN_30398 [Caenorhabditis brenneri]|uniref:Uncharacterized protein n=1 Tax=Caenorhabditis brenneri TaxID=135651 RepID=G0PHI3_CAEBE|nr:hypothetical protein CAEBREN_30398 [Caenorhabditis brenneri]